MFISKKKFLSIWDTRHEAFVRVSDLEKEITDLKNTIELLKMYKDIVIKRVDESIRDPLMDNLRVLLPDEIESIKDASIELLRDKHRYLHHRCAMTNLLLIRSIIGDEPSQRSTETKTEANN